MENYTSIKKKNNIKLSSLIISAFTQDMYLITRLVFGRCQLIIQLQKRNDLQQKEIQRKINSLSDGFKQATVRQNLKKNKYLYNQGDQIQNKFRQGENYKFIDSHRLQLTELLERYQTDSYTGLIEKDAKLRSLKKKHVFQKIIQNSFLKRVMKEVLTLFHLSISLASILSFIAYRSFAHFQLLVTGIVLLAFVLVSSIISQFRQRKGINIMENIDKIISKQCLVIRDDKEVTIPTANLVLGDIILLTEGMRCPTDIRILASTDLYVNQEIYTGSSQEEYVHPECSNKENPLSTKNIIFLGCKIVRGKGKGIVISIGIDTLIQDLGFQCSQQDYFPDSQLKKEFDKFLNILSLIVLTICLIVLLVNFNLNKNLGPLVHLQFMIGIIVSGLPLGMVIMKTLYLLIVQKQLNQENLTINYIESIGVLGQTTCICTDMTGTLTLNRPIVSNMWYDDRAVIHSF